jgi:hypothetical protein
MWCLGRGCAIGGLGAAVRAEQVLFIEQRAADFALFEDVGHVVGAARETTVVL